MLILLGLTLALILLVLNLALIPLVLISDPDFVGAEPSPDSVSSHL